MNAEVDGGVRELVLDSGAPVVVLFVRTETASALTRLVTAAGSVGASETSVGITVPGDRERRMRAVRVNSSEPAQGLLPASAFAAVFISNRDGFVRLVR